MRCGTSWVRRRVELPRLLVRINACIESDKIETLDLGAYLTDVCRDLDDSMPSCELKSRAISSTSLTGRSSTSATSRRSRVAEKLRAQCCARHRLVQTFIR